MIYFFGEWSGLRNLNVIAGRQIFHFLQLFSNLPSTIYATRYGHSVNRNEKKNPIQHYVDNEI